MTIYIAHSTSFDFRSELYTPIRSSKLNDRYQFILPHESSAAQYSSKQLFQNGVDLLIAEVSYPSTGLGIELGWADFCGVKIVAINRSDCKPSGAISSIAKNIYSYNAEGIIGLLEELLSQNS